MTEAELARNLHSVLKRVREGAEVVVEEDSLPVAVIRLPAGPGRPIAECIAIAKAFEARVGSAPVIDADFAADVQGAIDAHCEPLDTSVWD